LELLDVHLILALKILDQNFEKLFLSNFHVNWTLNTIIIDQYVPKGKSDSEDSYDDAEFEDPITTSTLTSTPSKTLVTQQTKGSSTLSSTDKTTRGKVTANEEYKGKLNVFLGNIFL